MPWITALGALAMVLAPAAVPSPARPGAWHQLGGAATSRPGKALHFYRTSQNPKALAFVATSSSSRPIRVFWWSYCEVIDDDTGMEEHQGRLSGVGSVTAYPPVLDGATRCYVSVNATPPARARVAAAVFDY